MVWFYEVLFISKERSILRKFCFEELTVFYMGAWRHTTLGNVIVDKVIKQYPNGVYEARVLIPNPKAKTDPTAPKFLEKKGKNQDSVSMMFPKTWTEDRG